MNEGHSAFLALERIRCLVEEQGFSFDQAREAVAAGNVFTTHTPVPAGIDRFGPTRSTVISGVGISGCASTARPFWPWGGRTRTTRASPSRWPSWPSRTAALANGVSQLHGEVSRKMWQHIWKEVPTHEVPIISITNGCHIRSYVSEMLDELYTRYAGQRWSFDAGTPGKVWKAPSGTARGRVVAGPRTAALEPGDLVAHAPDPAIAQAGRGASGDLPGRAGPGPGGPDDRCSRGASPPTSAATCSSRTPNAWRGCSTTRTARCSSFFAGKAHPKTKRGKRLIQHIAIPAARSASASTSSSSKTTTSSSPATWSRASMSGSTTPPPPDGGFRHLRHEGPPPTAPLNCSTLGRLVVRRLQTG